LVIEGGAVGFAEGVELGGVEDFVQPFVEGVTRGCGQLAAVLEFLLPLSLLARAHRQIDCKVKTFLGSHVCGL